MTDLEIAEKYADSWNRSTPVGASVTYLKSALEGKVVLKTTSPAYVVGGEAAVELEHIGLVLLSKTEPFSEKVLRVQKIANYEQRLRAYRSDCTQFWRGEFLWMGTTALIILFGLVGFLASKGAHFPLDLDWKVVATALWAVLMIPPVVMMHPKKPHPDDVIRDQVLRRAFNMDDTVSKEI